MLLQKTKQISSQIPSQTHKFQTVSGLRSGFVCLSDRKVPVTFFFALLECLAPFSEMGNNKNGLPNTPIFVQRLLTPLNGKNKRGNTSA